MFLWDMIESGDKPERRRDRLALGAMLRGVPQEMHSMLLNKKTVKEAWEAIKTMRLGADRVKEVNAQKLLGEFEAVSFKPRESIDDFSIRITKLATDLKGLGEKSVDDSRVVRKFLRVVPPRYSQVSVAIEMVKNVKELTIEELIAHLRAAEDRFEPSVDQVAEKMPKLLLTEEEWAARSKNHVGSDSSSGTGNKGKGRFVKKEKPRARAGGDGRDSGVKLTSMGTPRRRGRCRKCNIYGHFAKECKTKMEVNERQEAAHHATGDTEGALLVAQVCNVVRTVAQGAQHVFLNQERVFPSKYDEGAWVLDTGATNHMTGCRSALATLDESVWGAVRFGDGSTVEIQGLGAIAIAGKNSDHRVLTEVYYIPSLKCNIVSLGQLEEAGCRVEIDHGIMTVFERHQSSGNADLGVLIRAERKNRLYIMKVNLTALVCLLSKMDEEAWLWHARYGHLNFRSLCDLGSKQMVEGLPVIRRAEQVCNGCALGKHHRTPFPKASKYRAKHGLELVRGDLCGQITPPTPGGKSYFLLTVDDYSRFMWLELLASKSEALEYFKKFKVGAEVESGHRLKAFRTDRGGEFHSRAFLVFCNEQGIRRNTTTAYTPQQNGVVERRNQTIVEMARCLLKSMNVPGKFWGEAVKTAVYLLNRSPTKSLTRKTPFEVWYGRKPSVRHLRTFGCKVYAKRMTPGINKLADRSTPGVFLGYEPGTKGYRVYDPVSNKLLIARDVIFSEKEPWNWGEKAGQETGAVVELAPKFSVEYADEFQDNTVPGPTIQSGSGADSADSDTDAEFEPISPAPSIPSGGGAVEASPHTPGSSVGSTQQIQWATPPTDASEGTNEAPRRYRTLPDLFESTDEIQNFEYSGLCLMASEEPATVEDALSEPCWREAMESEMKAIKDNQTWVATDLPPNQKAIGLKWVFKVKKDPDGNVVKHKARLVAKGYAQRQGVDFEEVFAPVARIETVRVLLALAAQSGWEVHHMHVKSAFLNGDLTETVFVQQPPGFNIGNEGKVLKLKKALYGLKQAPRAWNAKLDKELISLGFVKSKLEHAVYRRQNKNSFLLVGVYVDDLVISGPSVSDIRQFKLEMKTKFNMSDLGLLSYYLGIEVKQGRDGISLSQNAYAMKILESPGMLNCNPCATPMEARLKLSRRLEDEVIEPTAYRSVIGSLRYLVNTRPDIAFVVGVVSRFMETPSKDHWAAVKHILRYLKGTINFGCKYGRGTDLKPFLIRFSDSDFAGDSEDRKSTTGVVYFFGKNLVTWASQKQKIVALSSCEAEYVAGAAAACQGIWLSRLVGDLMGTKETPVKLLMDNMSAIALSKNPVHHDRSKHIDTKYHFLRECIEEGKVEVEHVGTENQLADIFTKSLGRIRFMELRKALGVVDVQQV